MDNVETIALSSHLLISPYKRYVDDIYLQTTGKEMANQFHKAIDLEQLMILDLLPLIFCMPIQKTVVLIPVLQPMCLVPVKLSVS